MATSPKLSLSVISWLDCIWTTDLPSASKLIAAYLRSYMNAKHDMAWPSLQRIERETGLGLSTVCKHIEILEQAGWLKRNRGHGGSVNKSTEYIACFPLSLEESIGQLGTPPNGVRTPPNGEGYSTQWSTVLHQTHTNTQMNTQMNITTACARDAGSTSTPIAQKFRMFLWWSPPKDQIDAHCLRAGKNTELITDEVIQEFREHWSEETAHYTESQWIQKLLKSATALSLREKKHKTINGSDW